jgi:hypothetical protein
MNFPSQFIWIAIGVGLAALLFKFQQWSVLKINPQRKALSSSLIVVGAFLRWLIIALAFFWALKHSYSSLFLLFTSFSLSRFIILWEWNKKLSINQEHSS